ncbi:hypothetical protein D0A34_03220 [Microcoleus vaginatus PCC 9802]|nr:hypothetical protein D0A34_03220 [Microcoleus vaginatus PCC 9802]
MNLHTKLRITDYYAHQPDFITGVNGKNELLFIVFRFLMFPKRKVIIENLRSPVSESLEEDRQFPAKY